MAGVFSFLSGLFSSGAVAEGYKVAEPYAGLRNMVLTTKPEAVGLKPNAGGLGHPLYTAPGSDTTSRQAAYRELFRYALEPGLLDKIRRATNGNFALGNERFASQVATMIGRCASPGQSGRPRKLIKPDPAELF